MTKGFVYYRPQAGVGLLQGLVRTHEGVLHWVMDERVDGDRFVRLAEWADRQPWQQGRCFGPQLEIRWRATGPDGYELWLLTESNAVTVGEGWECRVYCADDQVRTMYLWGRWRTFYRAYGAKQAWIETRVPRALPYPLTADKEGAHVVMHIMEYRDQGMVRFTRLYDVSVEES